VNNARSIPSIYTPPRTSVSTSQDIETHLGPIATLLPSAEMVAMSYRAGSAHHYYIAEPVSRTAIGS
jgi:hypothetical protein